MKKEEKTFNELCEEILKPWNIFIEEYIFPACKGLCKLILWICKKINKEEK